MRIVINIILLLAVVGLSYMLYDSIAEPIEFKEAWKARETKVKTQLEKIRTAQVAYKNIVGEYAPTFDTLQKVLSTEEFVVRSVIGDPDDPNAKLIITETRVNALDSMTRLGIDLADIRYVPYTDNQEFDLTAKVLDEYQNAKNIPVLQVSVRIKDYMGPWADPDFSKYDANYKPNYTTKFGDLTRPSTDGNWRK